MNEYKDHYEEDDDGHINGHPIEDLNNIKDDERGIMLAERKVDEHIGHGRHRLQAKRV